MSDLEATLLLTLLKSPHLRPPAPRLEREEVVFKWSFILLLISQMSASHDKQYLDMTGTSTRHEKIYLDFLCFFRLTLDQDILKNKPYVGPFGRKLNHTLLDAAQKLKYKVTNRDCLGTAQNLFGDI